MQRCEERNERLEEVPRSFVPLKNGERSGLRPPQEGLPSPWEGARPGPELGSLLSSSPRGEHLSFAPGLRCNTNRSFFLEPVTLAKFNSSFFQTSLCGG